jgi:hypothetical protein
MALPRRSRRPRLRRSTSRRPATPARRCTPPGPAPVSGPSPGPWARISWPPRPTPTGPHRAPGPAPPAKSPRQEAVRPGSLRQGAAALAQVSGQPDIPGPEHFRCVHRLLAVGHRRSGVTGSHGIVWRTRPAETPAYGRPGPPTNSAPSSPPQGSARREGYADLAASPNELRVPMPSVPTSSTSAWTAAGQAAVAWCAHAVAAPRREVHTRVQPTTWHDPAARVGKFGCDKRTEHIHSNERESMRCHAD